MKLKSIPFVASAVVALTLSSGASAMTSFGDCAATKMAKFDGSIVDAAIATPELSTLVDAVVAAGLDEALATTEGITVFAPTNDAFNALPTEVLNAVVGDMDLLTGVLTYHVTASTDDPRRYSTAVQRNTLQGQKVYFSRGASTPLANNASVSCQGVKADNGTVWIIDSVLLPNL